MSKNLPATRAAGSFASRFSDLASKNPAAATQVASLFRDRAQNVTFMPRLNKDNAVTTVSHTVGGVGGGALGAFYDKKFYIARNTFSLFLASEAANNGRVVKEGDKFKVYATKENAAAGKNEIASGNQDDLFELAMKGKTDDLNKAVNSWIDDYNNNKSDDDPELDKFPKSNPIGLFNGWIPYAGLITFGGKAITHMLVPEEASEVTLVNNLDAFSQGAWDGFIGGLGYRMVLESKAVVSVIKEDKK